ncbi:hypothetical protein K7X08_022029 [Anisodus acutangulus]|uniref:Uncharacterized protein n=1 Tax=Anisodus acutangulus TaxID=402998 RepID=A0A9Q1L6U2_9SOLA|nr:hypothetical protein K7X08_022029 [Anisodus acutangulus]
MLSLLKHSPSSPIFIAATVCPPLPELRRNHPNSLLLPLFLLLFSLLPPFLHHHWRIHSFGELHPKPPQKPPPPDLSSSGNSSPPHYCSLCSPPTPTARSSSSGDRSNCETTQPKNPKSPSFHRERNIIASKQNITKVPRRFESIFRQSHNRGDKRHRFGTWYRVYR